MLLKYCVFPWRYDLGALANAPAGAAHPWGRTRVTGARGLLGGRWAGGRCPDGVSRCRLGACRGGGRAYMFARRSNLNTWTRPRSEERAENAP
eukprot:scaffold20825_cov64-Phaeocystis_antarctica.AAC.11